MRALNTRIILIIAIVCGACFFARAAGSTTCPERQPADSVEIINDINANTNVRVEQPNGLSERLVTSQTDSDDDNTNSQGRVAGHSRTGFRVEVFADNNVRTAKVQAASKKRQLQARFPQYNVYLVFESPFWRVRMGDFNNRAAAESAMEDVRRAIPSLRTGLRVVRCSINN